MDVRTVALVAVRWLGVALIALNAADALALVLETRPTSALIVVLLRIAAGMALFSFAPRIVTRMLKDDVLEG